MSVVSVSMPEELLERIDTFADEHGYTGRSEVVREASRDLLSEFEDRKLEGRELMGIVTVVFDYETTSVEEKMMHLRHEHEETVASNFHSHVGSHHCMELSSWRGASRRSPPSSGRFGRPGTRSPSITRYCRSTTSARWPTWTDNGRCDPSPPWQ
jgi:CopG family nickel-responsive transcriptional regulator